MELDERKLESARQEEALEQVRVNKIPGIIPVPPDSFVSLFWNFWIREPQWMVRMNSVELWKLRRYGQTHPQAQEKFEAQLELQARSLRSSLELITFLSIFCSAEPGATLMAC